MSFNRGVNELNRCVNELNRGVNRSVARQGCNLLRAAVTSVVTSQGCYCGNLQIHPLDLGQAQQHLRALKGMGHEPSESFITSMLELKLDVDTMFEWQRHSQERMFLNFAHYTIL